MNYLVIISGLLIVLTGSNSVANDQKFNPTEADCMISFIGSGEHGNLLERLGEAQQMLSDKYRSAYSVYYKQRVAEVEPGGCGLESFMNDEVEKIEQITDSLKLLISSQ